MLFELDGCVLFLFSEFRFLHMHFDSFVFPSFFFFQRKDEVSELEEHMQKIFSGVFVMRYR